MRRRLATRHHLALVAAAGVIVAMVAAIVSFNAFEGWSIEREAEGSLDEALGWEPQDGMPATRLADYLEFDEDLTFSRPAEGYASTMEDELAAWCVENFELDVVRRVEVCGRTCYVEMTSNGWYPDEYGYTAAYVDATSQYELVRTVNVVLGAITLVGCVAAGCAGWYAGRRVEASEAARKRFYENMSHELKTPLAAIRGYAEGVTGGVVEPEHAARAITREADRMTRLVEQILGLSRIEAGAVEPHVAPVEAADFVQDCLMPFEGVVRTRGLQVELDLAPGEIVVDDDLMGHALENVLANAVRHAEHVVRVGYDGRELWVENDGAVPDPADFAGMFERFRTGEGGSTGIGLALAREIATLHGMRLEASLHDGLLRMAFVVQDHS